MEIATALMVLVRTVTAVSTTVMVVLTLEVTSSIETVEILLTLLIHVAPKGPFSFVWLVVLL